MNSFWQDNPRMMNHLFEVNGVIEQSMTVKQEKMNEILQDLAKSGGKRVRPGLCLIGAGFGAKSFKSIYPLAAVVEMLHLANCLGPFHACVWEKLNNLMVDLRRMTP